MIKKTVRINGRPLIPLTVGERAIIQIYGGGHLRTSAVQAITQDNSRYIEFETQNSVYHLLPQFAAAAKMPEVYVLCA